RGYWLAEITLDPTRDPTRLERGKRFVTEGLADGSLKPIIAKTFPLDEIVEAHRYLESNQQIRKVVGRVWCGGRTYASPLTRTALKGTRRVPCRRNWKGKWWSSPRRSPAWVWPRPGSSSMRGLAYSLPVETKPSWTRHSRRLGTKRLPSRVLSLTRETLTDFTPGSWRTPG